MNVALVEVKQPVDFLLLQAQFAQAVFILVRKISNQRGCILIPPSILFKPPHG
jgi:hypothetical protein